MKNKEMSWVPVFDEDKDNYVPRQYETKDIYQGKDCLPIYDNKENCEQWCFNHAQDFYVGRWLKAVKYLGDENNQASLKPGDYIQIKEVVDGIGLGYIDDKKHLLFNTKYLNSYLSFNFELMSEDFNPAFTTKLFTDIRSSEDILNEITELENQSFEGWSDEAVNGYLTACKTIKEKYGTRKRYI